MHIPTCCGCLRAIGDGEAGRKVVEGCEGEYPPGILASYCRSCPVPSVKQLAELFSGYVIRGVSVLSIRGFWQPLWEGRIFYDDRCNCFTDGYECVISEEDVPDFTFD